MMNLKIQYGTRNIFLSFLKSSSCVIALICVFINLLGNTEYVFWILPVVYSFFMLLLGDTNIVYNAPGITVLNIVMYCRYCITPFFYCLTGDLSIYAKSYEYLNVSILLMMFEMIFIMFAILFTGSKTKVNKRIVDVTEFSFYESKYGFFISIVALIIVAIVAWRNQYLVGGVNLLLKGTIDSGFDVTETSGLVGVLWQALLAWLYIFICSKIKKKELRSKHSVLLLVVVSMTYIFFTFIGQTAISRWYTVVSFSAVYFTIYKLFPKNRKVIIVWILIPVVIGIIIVSIYKNSQYLSFENANLWHYFKDLFDVSTLDSYFAGPVSVNNAISVKESSKVNIIALFYDIVNNMPVVNHWFDLSNATVNLYASYLGRRDQIVPLVGQSSMYFSYLFAPLLGVLSVVVLRKFDAAYYRSNNSMVFVYAFSGTWVALMNITNMTICLSWFYNRIIPLILIMKFVQLLGQSRIERKGGIVNERASTNI